MNALELYLIFQMDGFLDGIKVLAILSLGISIICILGYFITLSEPNVEEQTNTKFKRGCQISITAFFVSLLIITFVPNTKNLIMMYGLNESFDSVKKNEEIEKLPKDYVEYMDRYFEEKLKKEEKVKKEE